MLQVYIIDFTVKVEGHGSDIHNDGQLRSACLVLWVITVGSLERVWLCVMSLYSPMCKICDIICPWLALIAFQSPEFIRCRQSMLDDISSLIWKLFLNILCSNLSKQLWRIQVLDGEIVSKLGMIFMLLADWFFFPPWCYDRPFSLFAMIGLLHL